MKLLSSICVIIGITMLTTNAFSWQMMQCPPVSALHPNGDGWTLDTSYTDAGWHLVQKRPGFMDYSKLIISDKSSLSVRLTSGSAYLPNEANDNFNPNYPDYFFRITCSYVDSVTSLRDGKQRKLSVDVESTHGNVDWSANKEFKPQYNQSIWANYLKTHNKEFIDGGAEGMVCTTVAGTPGACSLPYKF